MRAFVPRWHSTIFSANTSSGMSGSVVGSLSQMALPYGASAALTTGVDSEMPAVMEAPEKVAVTSSSPVRVSVDSNARVWVDAATAVTHGERWLAVEAVGPSLPAEAATNTPAS